MIRLGAALAFVAVALGAFGAHGLKERISPAMLEVYRTGVLYHLVHALGVLIVAVGRDRIARPTAVAALFTAGIVIFSGSLYALSITGARALGAVTPVGGLLFMAGWITLALNR